MKNLFIDTNVWLSLYDFSPNDLTKFSKINEFVKKGEIKLFLTTQIWDEFLRNRELKIKNSLSKFSDLSLAFPNFCKSYNEYNSIKDNFDSLNCNLNKFKNQILEDIANHNLPADKFIVSLFNSIEIINSDIYLQNAIKRINKGNPPGKNNSFCDAINWEFLLSVIPNGEDLYFISNDKDYKSPLNENEMNGFLISEWKHTKNSNLYFYSNLNNFLTLHIKEIELKDERSKVQLIEQLFNSPNFSMTHNIISKLACYNNFDDNQLKTLKLALINNNQVGYILGDQDINSFYKNVFNIKKDGAVDLDDVCAIELKNDAV